MEATSVTQERALSSDKAVRIVEAMRESVGEVGIAGSTFERVAAKAGVSRGLLHYYFGSKEKLLVEVIRRDTEIRISELGADLEAANSPDELIGAFFGMFERTMSEGQGYVYMVSELFVAGRHSEELTRMLGELYRTAREAFATILEQKAGRGRDQAQVQRGRSSGVSVRRRRRRLGPDADRSELRPRGVRRESRTASLTTSFQF